jgi:hypothetical protein
MGVTESRDLAPPVRITRFVPAGLAWKLNRLRCMTPAEIGHRVIKAASMRVEKMGFARTVVPAADLTKRAKPWLDCEAKVDPAPYVRAADRIAEGRLDIFAMQDVQLGSPPRWNRDPKTGIEAPLDFGKTLDYRDASQVGDCKYLWEPNRHLQLVTLAQAYCLTKEARYAIALREQLDSWFTACPYLMGPNWSSALEAALRLINWSIAWELVGGPDSKIFDGAQGIAFRDRWLTSVFQHAEFVSGHYSLHSSANNHLIGELAGVVIASIAWPHWERSKAWFRDAHAMLEREALLQNAPDGVNREQAVSYQQWELDLLMLPMLAAEASGLAFSAAYRARVEAMLVYLASIIDVKGNVPMFGDADDGYVVRLDPRDGFSSFRSLLATGAILFNRGEFKVKAGALDDKTRWLLGAGADAAFAAVDTSAVRLPMRQEFPDGGYYVLGADFETSNEIRLIADAGPLGYREIAAHGHADALSFTLSVGGEEFFVDPGTFAYHTEAEWRSYFRGTAAHNTVRVDGLDQSQPGGNFMWLRKAQASCSRWMTSIDEDFFEGWHDGYLGLADPVMHRRSIHLDKRARRIVIEDTLQMNGEHSVELFFHCHEAVALTPSHRGFQLTKGARTLNLRLPNLPSGEVSVLEASTDPIGGWISRRFDRKERAPTLVWSGKLAGRCLLRTEIDC